MRWSSTARNRASRIRVARVLRLLPTCCLSSFSDKRDCEQFLIRAQHRLDITAFDKRYESIGSDRHLTVGGKKMQIEVVEYDDQSSTEEAVKAIERLAVRIAADYRRQPLLLLGVLKGALCFTADLARALAGKGDGPSEIMVDYVTVARYGALGSSGGTARDAPPADRIRVRDRRLV